MVSVRLYQPASLFLKALTFGATLYLQNVRAIVYVTDETELKTVLIVTELNLNLYNGTPAAADVKELLTEPNRNPSSSCWV